MSPHSPIKTRRGRAKAQAQTASKQAAVEEELPPDAIIYEAPPIRQRSTAGPLTDISRNPNLEQPEDAASTAIEQPKLQSHRPAPPPPVGVIFSPPRPGLVLKQQGRLLKAEAASAAANNVGSPDTSDANTTVPEFSATAPLLQIFPAARPAGKGGRGRNTARSLIHPLGLDPTALRHITSSNTLKNQRYICSTLETLVVMKDGKRPESPTSKVKTILEKKKEEQERGRMERAARRIGNKLDLGDTGSVDSGDMEMRDFSEEPSDGRHTRAAGDEEDFESPQRPKVEQEDMDMEFENGAKPKKRVKWNKNLLHRFEMDENDFEGIRRGAEIARTRSASKGCLAARV